MDPAPPPIESAAVEFHPAGETGDMSALGYIGVVDVNADIFDVKTAAKKPSGGA
jgi:hypothetical protein